MMLRTVFLLMFLWILPAKALTPQQICQAEAQKINQVILRYKYGDLDLVQKSSAEISAECGDNAAGCCRAAGGRYTIYAKPKIIKVENTVCLIPVVSLDYDFSGTYIEVTNEYEPCKTRAVLRHELQHFMIWKTGRELQLKQTKKLLTELAQEKITACTSNADCNHNYLSEFKNLVNVIAEKWGRIIHANNVKLDENDHDFNKEVNYRVCLPYSFKKISFKDLFFH